MSDHPTGDAAPHHDINAAGDADHINAPGLVPNAADGAPRELSRKTVSKLMIMASSSDRAPHDEAHRAKGQSSSRSKDWNDFRIDPVIAAHDKTGGKGRKTSAIIAVAVVAGIAGAVGTAMATAGFAYFTNKPDPAIAVNQARTLDESMTRIEADLAALRSNVDRASKATASQAGKTADRLDRIEKAQAEPAAKLAKLTETVEKLRVASAAPPPAPAPVAMPAPAPVASAPAKEVTGSIPAKEPAPAPKPEVARLPTLDGWVLHDVGNGSATIEGRQGIFEVFAGDPVPGLGRVDAIRRQDGRWVVVTSKGLIIAR